MFRNGLEPIHLLIVLIVLVLLFGAKRLPDMAKSVGQSMKIFKNEVKDLREDSSSTPAPPTVPPTEPSPTDKV
ncbi:Sec-independent protein translocase subunit TatA [Cellulomonas sp. P24]|uniref:Sec-independent protein translocase subunit TatA n=1 Tax=Cellulomonas sp. P24 TaxID=2885206 RepID=UPI00216B3258|nr:Sec-independent protein translocase subunit TatA [Cellulomonas sp. P24]MCR6491896.1 Sec-independent protein translocase subunit TatA [Cellulomonas sp. P24]